MANEDDERAGADKVPAKELERDKRAVAIPPVESSLLSLEDLDDAVERFGGAVRGVAQLEHRAARDGVRWDHIIEFSFAHNDAGAAARLIVTVDRELRRVPSLLDAVRRRDEIRYGGVPRPISPRAAGLQIREASAGSLDVVVVAWGALATVAQSSPMAVVSMVQLLWSAGALPRRVLREWRHQRNNTQIAAPNADVGKLIKLSREAIKDGHDEVGWEVVGPDTAIRFHARKRR